jgi:hypothetical protein
MCKDLHEAYSNQIQREDNLTNQRLRLFLTVQAFLFGALVVIWPSGNGSAPEKEESAHQQQATQVSEQGAQGLNALAKLLPLLGIVSCLLAAMGIGASVKRLKSLKTEYAERKRTGLFPEHFPEPYGAEGPPYGMYYSYGFPFAVGVVWLLLW